MAGRHFMETKRRGVMQERSTVPHRRGLTMIAMTGNHQHSRPIELKKISNLIKFYVRQH